MTSLPLGECYSWAWRFVKDNDGILVHGTLINPWDGRQISHAWVELDGYIFDWQTQHTDPLTINEFIRRWQPSSIKRYSKEEALINVIKFEHFGPWHETRRRNPDEELRNLERQAKTGDQDAALQLVTAMYRAGQLIKREHPIYPIEQGVSIQPLNDTEVILSISILHDVFDMWREQHAGLTTYLLSRADFDRVEPLQNIKYSYMNTDDIPGLGIALGVELAVIDPNWPAKSWAPYYVDNKTNKYRLGIPIPNIGDYVEQADLFRLTLFGHRTISTWMSGHWQAINLAVEIYHFNELCQAYSDFKRQQDILTSYQRDVINNALTWLRIKHAY